MGIEIERKFLVNKEKWKILDLKEYQLYTQGYISVDPHKTIRVRIAGNNGYLTIKGISHGAGRAEFEYPIPAEDARQLLDDFCDQIIIKKRFRIEYQGNLWEVDEFLGENEGLIIAEIELLNEDQYFEKPGWITDEVTGDEKYYNANLTMNPYSQWQKEM